jgi:hypothetical protein
MIHDDLNRFNNAQAVTTTAVSTDVIDLSADRNLGIGRDMSVEFRVDVAAKVSAANETYDLEVETATDEAFTTPISLAKRTFTNAQATADLALNDKVILPIAQDERCERYIRTKITTAGTSPSITYTSILQPSDAIDAEVRGGYANNSKIS